MQAETNFGDGFHISLSIGQHLWTDLFSNALPAQVGGGDFSSKEHVGNLLNIISEQVQTQTRLLSEKTPLLLSAPVGRIKSRFGKRLQEGVTQLKKQAEEIVKLNGKWTLHITKEGSRFSYSHQALTVSARIRAAAEGVMDVGYGRIQKPFKIEKHIRGVFTLGNIHYDKNQGTLVGGIRDLHLDLGERPSIKMAEVWLDQILESRLSKYKAFTLMQVSQINKSLEESLGQMKFMANIDDISVKISDANLLLQIHFLFQQKSPLSILKYAM